MEELLRHIISFPSITGDFAANHRLLDFLDSYLTERGMQVRRYEKNGVESMVATTRPHSLAPKLMLVAHSDVVPASEKLFTLEKKEGKYYGRGTLDMKFAIACYLQLIDDIKANLADYDIGIMITTDEEYGGANGVGYLVNDLGYRPGVCIIPDGGMNWEIETFAKGVYWMDIAAKGKSAHASRPWDGEHAVHKLIEALMAIRQAFPFNGDPNETIVSIGTVTGGEAANQIAEQAHAKLDIRTGSIKDHQTIAQHIVDIAKRFDVAATVDVIGEPCVNDPSHPYLQRFHTLITEATGTKHAFTSSLAATDGRYFTSHGIPCIIVQPPGGDHHTDTEWLSVEGFEQFFQILKKFSNEVASMPQEETAPAPAALSALS